MFGIRAARLFDGEGSSLVRHPLVLIDRGRITAVESSAVTPPAVADVVDLGDVTLLPGLIDTHLHLGFDAGPDPVQAMISADDATLLDGMQRAAARALAAGVTTVRDLGDRSFLAIALRERLRAGGERGPEILSSGPPLTISGGHCDFMGGVVRGQGEIRRTVREHVERGVDVIKVMASGGLLTGGSDPLQPQFSCEELAAAVDEAHRGGRTVTVHAHSAKAIEYAVEAGVDGIEHASFFVDGGVDADPRLVDLIASRGIAVCPCPPPPLESAPVALPPTIAALLGEMIEVRQHLYRAGVRIVMGTDAGISLGHPHDLLPYAVESLGSLLGASNIDALRAATSVAADVCGVGDRKGRLRAGMDADIVAVAGNPIADVTAVRDVRAVVRAGDLIGPIPPRSTSNKVPPSPATGPPPSS